MGKTISFHLQSNKIKAPERWMHFQPPERARLLAFWLAAGFVAFVAFVACYWLAACSIAGLIAAARAREVKVHPLFGSLFVAL